MDAWGDGAAYEPYIGRWSRLVAERFLVWLGVPPRRRWLDVGSGTGALTDAVLASCDPAQVVGVEPSEGFLAYAKEHVRDPRASFHPGDASALPVGDGAFDAVVSGLVLNFVPDRALALEEMVRAAAGGAVVAAYVWDYPGHMPLLNHLWDAAVDLDPAAQQRHEAVRFSFCRPEPLAELLAAAGLAEVEVVPVEVPTTFRDVDDYWSRFLGGSAPAPSYVMSLSSEHRATLREAVVARLPVGPDGTVSMTARAWAARGISRG